MSHTRFITDGDIYCDKWRIVFNCSRIKACEASLVVIYARLSSFFHTGIMRMDPAVTGLFSSFKSKFTGITVTPLEKLFFCAKAEIAAAELENMKQNSEISLVIPIPESLPPSYKGILLKYTYALQAAQGNHIQKFPFRILPSASLYKKNQVWTQLPESCIAKHFFLKMTTRKEPPLPPPLKLNAEMSRLARCEWG